MKTLPIFLILFCCNIALPAQDTLPHRLGINVGYHRGFLIAHRPLIVHLQKDNVNGFEASTTLQTNGSKAWHHIYNFPEIGLSLSMWELGNPEQLGKSVALIPFIDFPLIPGKRAAFHLKFGWGVGYVEKPFDSDNNHKNVAIGSRLNCALLLQPHVKFDLSSRLAVNGGLSLVHYSNGSVVIPNLGLNIASLTGGVKWNFGQSDLHKRKILPPFEKSRRYTMFLSASSKQVYPAEGTNYFAATFSANHAWQISRKNALGAGVDLFYDNSTYRKAADEYTELNNSFETLRPGIHWSYELVIADVTLVVNMGGYLYSKINDGVFYHRFGLRYRISKTIFACFNIKSHWGKADFAEFGVGYRIDKFKKHE